MPASKLHSSQYLDHGYRLSYLELDARAEIQSAINWFNDDIVAFNESRQFYDVIRQMSPPVVGGCWRQWRAASVTADVQRVLRQTTVSTI